MAKLIKNFRFSSLLLFILINFTSILAQTTCKNGLGRVLYERLPNQQLQGYDDDVVRDTAPPFRVLEKCQDLCLRDRSGSNNLVRPCTSFDFQPGSRIASFSGSAEYEESICYLTNEQAGPEGIGSLMLVPNSVHFNEICLTSSRPERECPSRRYVFERHPRKKLKLPISDIKEITAANRSDCEDKCLNEFSFVCRSGNFDSTMRKCTLSRFTRRTHPELLEDDPNSDYLENTCLNAERRCDGLAVFVKEENKRLGGPFEVDIFNNMTLEECQTMCLRAEKYFCRSVEFDDQTKQCILSEEDSISQKDDISVSSSLTHHFYDLVCLDNQRATDYPDNSVTSHLFSSGRRPDTAFQRYRNSRLGGEFHSEITGRSLSECLDECLRQTSFQCRSAVYSDRFRTCRLSRYNQKDGMRIIYDADYDYYENLMLNVVGGGDNDDHSGTRPDHGNGWPPGNYNGGKYPTDKYPNNDRPKYPDDRYPGDRPKYPDDRYPSDRPKYPDDRYPGRYPPSGGDRPPYDRPNYDYDRYPGGMYPGNKDRYPDSDRYPYGGNRDRYAPPGGNSISERYPYDDRDRYPVYPGNDRGRDRYPSRHPDRERNPYDSRYPPEDKYIPPYGPQRYPPISDNRLPGDGYPSRPIPPPDDRAPYPYHDYISGRFPPSSRYPDDDYGGSRGPPRYPPRDPYPPREPYPSRDAYPPREPAYPGRDVSDPIFPDKRYRPSSIGSRYPMDSNRYPPSRYPLDTGRYGPPDSSRYPPDSSRYPPDSSRYPPDSSRYPPEEIIHSAGRPEPDSSKRFPPPPTTIGSKYPPTSPNRFPVGTDRYPIDIYKYGNGNRFLGRPSYDRPPPPYYDMDYEDRYRDRPYSPYDREFESSFGRRPPGGGGHFPPYESPYSRPYDGSTINQLPPESLGPLGPPGGSSRPQGGLRCDEADSFKQIAARHKMRRQFVRRSSTVTSLLQCERECIENRDFVCRSFNYRDQAASTYDDRELPNCELSDRDTRELDVHNPTLFDAGNYDFYERSAGRGEDCLDVSQTCNEEGMEFTLRTPEGFVGRIYTYGFYDRCFFRGNGGTVNVLRISGPQGYPECGTQRYGDTLTNIIVVQFSDNVQTSRDKRYNLTCVFRGPGEAVVTSGYIGAGSGSPIPIEYLPAENTLSSKVRLMILYQGRPTTTIAVGDPLTFRLEAQDGYNHITDIFATNVVARDPYSGRSIQLIDRFGCPVDPYVFPELDKLRDGDMLEARFNAFKIPESNFLVFEATVRSCREGCQPAYCPGPSGRSEPSFGRKRRSINENDTIIVEESDMVTKTANFSMNNDLNQTTSVQHTVSENEVPEEPEQVREMIEVFESRDEIDKESFPRKLIAPVETVCLTPSEYHGLISGVILLMILLFGITLVSGLAYRRYWKIMSKNRSVDRTSPVTSFTPSSIRTHERFTEVGHLSNGPKSHGFRPSVSLFGGGLQKTFATGNLSRMCQIPVMNPIRNTNNSQFDDPSEPIYTDPSLFERSRSLRSLSVEQGSNEV